MFVATEIITDNAEIAVNSDIIIRCPNARNENIITWQIRLQENTAVGICTRRSSEKQCWTGGWQSPQYRNRVEQDTSAGPDVASYSIRVSGVFINETGRYSCEGDLTNLDVFTNVRIISELHFVLNSFIMLSFTCQYQHNGKE